MDVTEFLFLRNVGGSQQVAAGVRAGCRSMNNPRYAAESPAFPSLFSYMVHK